MPNDRSKGNLAVNVGENLLKRINEVASALNKSQAQYVKDVLDKATKAHHKDVEGIRKLQERISDRENSATHC
jgi:putative cell wall-binding protein